MGSEMEGGGCQREMEIERGREGEAERGES